MTIGAMVLAATFVLGGGAAAAGALTPEDLGVGVTDDGQVVLPQDYQ